MESIQGFSTLVCTRKQKNGPSSADQALSIASCNSRHDCSCSRFAQCRSGHIAATFDSGDFAIIFSSRMPNISPFLFLKFTYQSDQGGYEIMDQQLWNYLKSVVQQSNFTHQVQQGSWLWMYDNLNIYQRICHERQGLSQCQQNK